MHKDFYKKSDVALALFVSTCRAVRRPLNREASDSVGLHAFLCLEVQFISYKPWQGGHFG